MGQTPAVWYPIGITLRAQSTRDRGTVSRVVLSTWREPHELEPGQGRGKMQRGGSMPTSSAVSSPGSASRALGLKTSGTVIPAPTRTRIRQRRDDGLRSRRQCPAQCPTGTRRIHPVIRHLPTNSPSPPSHRGGFFARGVELASEAPVEQSSRAERLAGLQDIPQSSLWGGIHHHSDGVQENLDRFVVLS